MGGGEGQRGTRDGGGWWWPLGGGLVAVGSAVWGHLILIEPREIEI